MPEWIIVFPSQLKCWDLGDYGSGIPLISLLRLRRAENPSWKGMNSISVLFLLGTSCWNVQKQEESKKTYLWINVGLRVKDLKLRKNITGNLILLRGKERACID